MRLLFLLLALLLVAVPAEAQLHVDEAFPGLAFNGPVGLGHDGVDPELLYVVEQRGIVQVFENTPGVLSYTAFLDIRDRVSAGGEKGLLGLAFHPDYEANGYFFVYYSTTGAHRSRVSRFERSGEDVYPPVGDPDSEVVLLEVPQPFSNHNGGALAFGEDGYLYVSLGDGGSGGDPQGHGQNNTTLLGTILRLDVDGGGNAPDCGGSSALYTVPEDNGLADGPGGACDEIYAWGLRNPWRMSFDREDGTLWIADVGQGSREEINIGQNGANYGWNTYEGTLCFSAPCDPEGFTFPVWEYNRQSPHCSVTGGYVYRGSDVPELAGKYVYGDYCSGWLWALDMSSLNPQNQLLDVGTYGGLTSFGEDAAGELYFVRSNGRVYRFDSDSVSSEDPATPAGKLRLDPAAPNPFAVATTFTFAVAETGPARLAVYDVLGREVAVLHDGPASEEGQTVTFEAGALPAGVYIARIEAAGVTQTRKVVLVR